MITDEEIKVEGMKALYDALGDVQAERFISLVMRVFFGYTKVGKNFWIDRSVSDISSSNYNKIENYQP